MRHTRSLLLYALPPRPRDAVPIGLVASVLSTNPLYSSLLVSLFFSLFSVFVSAPTLPVRCSTKERREHDPKQ